MRGSLVLGPPAITSFVASKARTGRRSVALQHRGKAETPEKGAALHPLAPAPVESHVVTFSHPVRGTLLSSLTGSEGPLILAVSHSLITLLPTSTSPVSVRHVTAALPTPRPGRPRQHRPITTLPDKPPASKRRP